VPEASFADDLGLDSLDIIELIIDVEDEFGVDILDQNGEHPRTPRTMKDVLEYLRAELSGNE
jgi:acyl carrier protein